MDPQRFAEIVLAIDAMNRYGPRIGRTHAQKFLFLAENWLADLPRHRYGMHLYGPFAPDLNQEIISLSLGGIIRTQRDPEGFGERYSVEAGHVKKAREAGSIDGAILRSFEQLAHWLAPKRVRELEAISSAEFIMHHRPEASDDQIIERMASLKPHLRREEVATALEELRRYRTQIRGSASGTSAR